MADIILRDSDILSKEFSFKDKISVATEVATTLTEVIQTQGLAVNIQGNNYVTAEGWNCLGTMLGTYAQTEYVEPIKNPNGYKARVSIKQGENVLATAEAIATYGGFQKTPQAVYSMANGCEFKFNAILLYYSVYDLNDVYKQPIATNLFGIVFLDGGTSSTENYTFRFYFKVIHW